MVAQASRLCILSKHRRDACATGVLFFVHGHAHGLGPFRLWKGRGKSWPPYRRGGGRFVRTGVVGWRGVGLA